jgi:hypothetical protein
MRKSRRKFDRLHAFVTPEQRAFLHDDGESRYPDSKERSVSPALRDMLDFVREHYTLFLTWIASRGN